MKSTPSFFIVRLPTHERHMQCTATRTCSTFFRPKPCIRGVTTLWHQSETRPQYRVPDTAVRDRKSTRLNSSHSQISYAVFCLKKKKKQNRNVVLTVNIMHSDAHKSSIR